MILFFYKNLFQKSFNTCWFYRLLQKNIFGLFYHFSEKVLKVQYTKLSPSGHYAECFWNNQNTVKMHINFKANSNYLLLQFLFFHSLLFSYFKECTQITSVGNLQLLNAFQNQLYGPLLYLPILFWIFKRKHYYHFNIPSKDHQQFFSKVKYPFSQKFLPLS